MNFNLLLTCERGTEQYVVTELQQKGFTGTITKAETVVTITEVTKEDIIKAAYTLQTPTRICMLLGETDVSLDTEETIIQLETIIGALPFKELFSKDKTFHVECSREGMHEYNSVDAAQETGRLIKRYAKEALPFIPDVNLKKPDMLLHLHIEEEHAWLGLDVLGRDASKRPYKVFNNPHSLKGNIAACLVMASGWTTEKTLLDPYAGGGEVGIEAALFASHKSLHFYEKNLLCKHHPLFKEVFTQILTTLDAAITEPDSVIHSFDAQLRNVTAAKKNAKIAGVDKHINFSKLDVEWIDTKLAEKSVDCIITHPVEASKHIPADKAMKLHKSLFHQADFVLKKAGSLTFICQKPEDLLQAAEHYGFIVDEQKQIFTGKLPQWLLRMVRK